jgi:hypothetical protein
MRSPLNNQNYIYKPGHRALKSLLILAWIIGLGLLVAKHQAIFDWAKLRNYQAPSAIAQIATQDTMTDYGRKVFYVNHPELVPKDNFGNDCPNDGGEQTIVLGCYHPIQAGIFVLNVTDPRLDGVHQVTAAHEMLHAAYDRLSRADKDKVNQMLLDYYHNGLADQRIKDTIDAYKKTEPKDLVNEMHSIFGTEVATLPAPLEQYYQRYFTDRGQVVAFAVQYQDEFTSRQNIVTQDDAKLAQLKSQIQNLEADLKNKQSQLASTQADLNNKRSNGQIAAYNAGVPDYNAQVEAYNAEVEQVRSLIDQYNQLVNERNAVALEEDQLVKDLSTSAQPINN